jgi:hypothetical protein
MFLKLFLNFLQFKFSINKSGDFSSAIFDPDQKIAFDGEGFDFDFEKIRFEDHAWVLKK